MNDHEHIWLEPESCTDREEGRLWCKDKVWPDGTEYVRADLLAAAEADRERLKRALATAESEARRYAGFYPQSSDGWNTFLILADAITALGDAP